jgi:hypothetical protein
LPIVGTEVEQVLARAQFVPIDFSIPQDSPGRDRCKKALRNLIRKCPGRLAIFLDDDGGFPWVGPGENLPQLEKAGIHFQEINLDH